AGAAVLALLVIARMSGIVGKHESALTRESRLRAAAATLVAATSDEEIHHAPVETAVGFAGDDGCATLSIVAEGGVASAGAVPAQPVVADFPLTIRGQLCGMLTVETQHELGREERQALETLAAQTALALETIARAREAADAERLRVREMFTRFVPEA